MDSYNGKNILVQLEDTQSQHDTNKKLSYVHSDLHNTFGTIHSKSNDKYFKMMNAYRNAYKYIDRSYEANLSFHRKLRDNMESLIENILGLEIKNYPEFKYITYPRLNSKRNIRHKYTKIAILKQNITTMLRDHHLLEFKLLNSIVKFLDNKTVLENNTELKTSNKHHSNKDNTSRSESRISYLSKISPNANKFRSESSSEEHLSENPGKHKFRSESRSKCRSKKSPNTNKFRSESSLEEHLSDNPGKHKFRSESRRKYISKKSPNANKFRSESSSEEHLSDNPGKHKFRSESRSRYISKKSPNTNKFRSESSSEGHLNENPGKHKFRSESRSKYLSKKSPNANKFRSESRRNNLSKKSPNKNKSRSESSSKEHI